jgi:hypothetical protein
VIVGGPNNIVRTSFVRGTDTIPTIFNLYNNNESGYQIIKTPNLGFAICFSYLMAAIDFIRFGKMPWPEILNNGTGHE